MSSCLLSIEMNYPTYASGDQVLSDGKHSERYPDACAVLRARIDALPDARLLGYDHPDAVDPINFEDSGNLPEDYSIPEGSDKPTDIAAGVRRQLHAALTFVLSGNGDNDALARFDGVRWMLMTAGDSYGDDPNELYTAIAWLDPTGVCDDPVDGESFMDRAAMAAAIVALASVRSIVNATEAYRSIPAEYRDALAAAFDEAENALAPTAVQIRDSLTANTKHR